MAVPRPHGEDARLIVGLLAADREALAAGAAAATAAFGPASLAMPAAPFASSSYYADELGPAPLRAFLAFPERFDQTRLPAVKLAANRLERDLAASLGGRWPRPVNIDPGYLTLAKLVLASAKNFSHRIHLAHGIYAEVTLIYRDRDYQPLPWTFPDYAAGRYFPFLRAARKLLLE